LIPLQSVTMAHGELQIAQAEPEDLAAVLDIFDDVVAWLVAQGSVKQWGTTPFSANPRLVERFREHIANDTFLIALKEEKAVGAICLNFSYPPYCWQGAPNDCAYVHPFGTSPSVRGQGIGSALLRCAEDYARRHNKPYLRLDCFAGTPKLLAYYESEGFEARGEFLVGD
jgi:GNAT superfamily N-acetyltransferase